MDLVRTLQMEIDSKDQVLLGLVPGDFVYCSNWDLVQFTGHQDSEQDCVHIPSGGDQIGVLFVLHAGRMPTEGSIVVRTG